MARLQDVIGYGLLSARPAAGNAGNLYYATDTYTVYRDNGASWDPISRGPAIASLLDYEPSTSLANGLSVAASTWTDLCSNQTFTPTDASSLIEIAVSGMCVMTTTSGNEIGSRVIVDSTGTPMTKNIGGNWVPSGSAYANALAGAGSIFLVGLSAAAHTVKVQLYSGVGTGTAYCQPNTNAMEFLAIRVLEHKL